MSLPTNIEQIITETAALTKRGFDEAHVQEKVRQMLCRERESGQTFVLDKGTVSVNPHSGNEYVVLSYKGPGKLYVDVISRTEVRLAVEPQSEKPEEEEATDASD